MITSIHKLFWIWNFDREEKWLNEMAAKGLKLIAVGGSRYTFEECTPGEYNIRLELLENLPSVPESRHYIKFLEETGAEYIGSVYRWVYFSSKTENGSFDLFSDNASRIRHLNKILILMGAFIPIILFFSIINFYFSIYFHNVTSQINLFIGFFLLGVSILPTYGCTIIWLKKRRLKKDQLLFE